MNRTTALLALLLAALLEAGGDALVRAGLHGSHHWGRAALLASGAIVLFAYGITVNTPAWDFGRLLGLYVVFFFVVAQVISWLAFGQPPTRLTLAGGTLIVLGGLLLSFGT